MAVSTMQVADFFRAKMEPDAGDVISSATLHKLVYFAQGFTLAITGEPLFTEPVYAMASGPFCRGLAEIDWTDGALVPNGRNFHKLGGRSVHVAESWIGRLEDARKPFSEQQLDILDDVWTAYGQFAGWKLREIVWDDVLWSRYWERARQMHGDSVPIPHEDMRRHFKALLAGVEAGHAK